MEGQRGDCRVRVNIGGKLTTLVYGKPCAVHIDPIEKKPLFHFLPTSASFSIATAGCNLHCKFCQNWQISQREPEKTRNVDMSPAQVVEAALKSGCKTIAYTYAEPTVFYEYMLDTCQIAHSYGVRNLWITAGFMEPQPLLELCPQIDAANVDLKGFTEWYYKEICFAELGPVLEALKILQKEGVWLEITNLIVPTLNDKLEEIGRMCDWIIDNLGYDVPLHFSRFWPMYQLKNLPPTPVEILTEARELAMSKGMHYVYVGNVPGHEGNNTYCANCKKLIIERVGFEILQNKVGSDGRCTECGHKVPGVWT
ncbi:MAG: AmmeMemoRadiSam system radical SAM enzyme [bacterium]